MAPKYKKTLSNPRLYSQHTNNPRELFEYTMGNLHDTFYMESMDFSIDGEFKAVCLSGTDGTSNVDIGPDGFRRIIVRPLGDINLMIPDPRDFDNPDDVNKAILLHRSSFLARADFKHQGTNQVGFGQIVNCYYEEGSITNSEFIGLRYSEPKAIEAEQSYLNIANIEGVVSGPTAFEIPAYNLQIMGNYPGGLGIPATDIPTISGDIKPIRIWVAKKSKKEDGYFQKGNCPNALIGAYSSLPRKVTTFFYYDKEQVLKAITRVPQEDHIKRTMWVFINKEQPRFGFPNNNVAGIQTDGGLFRGTTIEDVDYQTCYKDAKTWRAFAGFDSLERGMIMFGKSIAGKYAGKFRVPTGNYQEQADQLVWNYYASWNVSLNPKQLEELKRTGRTTKSGKLIKKTWQPNVKRFTALLQEFDDLIAKLSS